MIKKILFLIILLTGLVSAEYYVGETYLTSFNGTLNSYDVSLYNDLGKVVISPLVVENYVYFDLPLVSGNYTLFTSSENSSFYVYDSNDSLRVKPAIVLLEDSKGSFSLNLRCVKGDCNVSVVGNNDIVPRKSNIIVDNDNVYFDYDIINDSLVYLTYSNHTYTIPVVYLKEEVIETDVNEIVVNETVVVVENKTALVFLVSSASQNLVLDLGSFKSGDLKVQNNLGSVINNLEYTLTGDLNRIVSLNETHIDTLDVDEIYSNRLYVNCTEIGVYRGNVVLSNSEYSVELPLVVTVNAVVVTESNNTDYEGFNFEGNKLEEETSVNGTYVLGFVIIFILLVLILLIVVKVRQKNEKKFDEYIEQTKKR